ncbi:MAG: DUF1573 domain-containing protein [Saprospiraceae bacterium]|nr:DUF1573 domain-containing protein [Saprospiraceae bacterium]
MFKIVKIALPLVLAAGVFVSCQNANKDVRQEARQSIEGTSAVQPQSPNPMDPGATADANPIPTGPTTEIAFTETEFDFGTVKDGEKVSHTYKFKNTGKEPLVISNAQGSCGCTVPKWPRDPIAPGKSGEIVVEFDSKGKAGDRNQKVTLTANTNPPQTFLTLKGKVLGDPNAPAQEAPPIQINQ